MTPIHLYSSALIELHRGTVSRTYTAFAVFCVAFYVATQLLRRGVTVQVHPLTGADSGVDLVTKQLDQLGLSGSALPILHSTGVIAVSGNQRRKYPGIFQSLSNISCTPSAEGLHILLASPDDDARLLTTALTWLPPNTIYVPHQAAGLDFFEQLSLFKAASAVVCEEAQFAAIAKHCDPVAGLLEMLDRGVLSPLVVQGDDRNWSLIAGQTRTTFATEAADAERFAQFLVSVAEQISQGQVLSAALVGALQGLDENAPIAQPAGILEKSLRAVLNAFWL